MANPTVTIRLLPAVKERMLRVAARRGVPLAEWCRVGLELALVKAEAGPGDVVLMLEVDDGLHSRISEAARAAGVTAGDWVAAAVAASFAGGNDDPESGDAVCAVDCDEDHIHRLLRDVESGDDVRTVEATVVGGAESGDDSGDATPSELATDVGDATPVRESTPVREGDIPERLREAIVQADEGRVQERPDSSRKPVGAVTKRPSEVTSSPKVGVPPAPREVTPVFKTPKAAKGKR